MLVDSHAHLDFYDDAEPVLARAKAAGVGKVLAIGIGDGPATMHRALDLARAHAEVWASAGIHPQEAHQADAAALDRLRGLLADPRCIAVGEIGLDYYHLDNPAVDVQQAALVAQMQIAAEVQKPILIHCRTSELATPAAKAKYGPADAFADLMRLIGEHWTPTGLPGVMHCFSGSPVEAQQAFAGNVTYPKAVNIQQAARDVPADRFLVETDAPFLAPVPLRGKENEPAFVVHTAAFVAGLRGVTEDEIAEQTTRNFAVLFPATASS